MMHRRSSAIEPLYESKIKNERHTVVIGICELSKIISRPLEQVLTINFNELIRAIVV
jgi:hypothetical protein